MRAASWPEVERNDEGVITNIRWNGEHFLLTDVVSYDIGYAQVLDRL